MVDLVLLQRGGTAWGLEHGAITGFVSRGEAIAVLLGGTSLLVDRVVGVARQVRVRTPGPVVRRFWGGRCLGLAVCQGVPMIVVDPAAPPPELLEHGRDHDER